MEERVVLTLAEPYLDKGYHIYCDNFFSSPALAYNLLLRDTYMIGTCREKRKGVPATIKKRMDKRRTPRGASVADFAVDKDGRKLSPEVHCFFWMDKKPVGLINTITPPDVFATVIRHDSHGDYLEIQCPMAVKFYNQYMGGVDLADNLRKTYSCSRKGIKWYFRIFYYLLDTAVVNAFILYKETKRRPDMTQKEFRLILAEEMIEIACFRTAVGRHSTREKERYTGRHFPEYFQNKSKYCRAKGCKSRPSYRCDRCKVVLCAAPCFRKYHS